MVFLTKLRELKIKLNFNLNERRKQKLGYQFSSVARSCLTLFNPMDCSTPGFHDRHQLLELAQTHVHLAHWEIYFLPLFKPWIGTQLFQCFLCYAFSLKSCLYELWLPNKGDKVTTYISETHSNESYYLGTSLFSLSDILIFTSDL